MANTFILQQTLHSIFCFFYLFKETTERMKCKAHVVLPTVILQNLLRYHKKYAEMKISFFFGAFYYKIGFQVQS